MSSPFSSCESLSLVTSRIVETLEQVG
jgi:hypothetical protein